MLIAIFRPVATHRPICLFWDDMLFILVPRLDDVRSTPADTPRQPPSRWAARWNASCWWHVPELYRSGLLAKSISHFWCWHLLFCIDSHPYWQSHHYGLVWYGIPVHDSLCIIKVPSLFLLQTIFSWLKSVRSVKSTISGCRHPKKTSGPLPPSWQHPYLAGAWRDGGSGWHGVLRCRTSAAREGSSMGAMMI